jgi:hypothetical protein
MLFTVLQIQFCESKLSVQYCRAPSLCSSSFRALVVSVDRGCRETRTAVNRTNTPQSSLFRWRAPGRDCEFHSPPNFIDKQRARPEILSSWRESKCRIFFSLTKTTASVQCAGLSEVRFLWLTKLSQCVICFEVADCNVVNISDVCDDMLGSQLRDSLKKLHTRACNCTCADFWVGSLARVWNERRELNRPIWSERHGDEKITACIRTYDFG